MMSMRHEIAEAIIENGQIMHINKRLPRKRMKVHLIYDLTEKSHTKKGIARLVKATSGIYRNVDVAVESRKLRKSWERDVYN